jgi:hypothetical protein
MWLGAVIQSELAGLHYGLPFHFDPPSSLRYAGGNAHEPQRTRPAQAC